LQRRPRRKSQRLKSLPCEGIDASRNNFDTALFTLSHGGIRRGRADAGEQGVELRKVSGGDGVELQAKTLPCADVAHLSFQPDAPFLNKEVKLQEITFGLAEACLNKSPAGLRSRTRETSRCLPASQ